MSAIATDSNNVGYILARSYVGLVGRVLVDLAAWPLVASGLVVAAQRFSELATGALPCSSAGTASEKLAAAHWRLAGGRARKASPMLGSHQKDALA